MTDITQRLKDMLTPSVQALGFEIWGVTLSQNGRASILRIFIDGPTGVTIDDCARVSRQCSSVLDVEAPIQSAYTLEVSSPGMDRQFFAPEQYGRYLGKKLRVKLYQARDQRKQWLGLLLAAAEDNITLEVDGQPLVLTFNEIERANLVVENGSSSKL